MIIKNWKQEVCTIPNLLSLFRLIAIPVYMNIYQNAQNMQQVYIAGGVLIFSCITDWADGVIARQYDKVTKLGKVLDPLADKLTQLSLLICISIKHSKFIPVLGLFILKEILQVALGIISLTKGRILKGALFAGKICTTALFITLIFIILQSDISDLFIRAIVFTDIFFLMISLFSYIQAYYSKNTYFENFTQK